MEALKPALEALEGLISDIETSIMTNNAAAKQPNPKAPEAPNSIPNQPSKNVPVDSSNVSTTANSEKKKKKEKKLKHPAAPPVAPEIAQFLQCDLRVGRATSVSEHPEADGLYILQVTYANDETKSMCVGLRKYLTEGEISNRMAVTICNLKPRKFRGVASEVMILAGSVVSGEGEIINRLTYQPTRWCPPGRYRWSLGS